MIKIKLVKAGLFLLVLSIALPVLAWLSCLFIPESDGLRFYVMVYRMGLVLPLAGWMFLFSIVAFVVDYIMRIKGDK